MDVFLRALGMFGREAPVRYIYTYVRVYIYIQTYVYVYIYISLAMYMYLHTSTYNCIRPHTCAYTYKIQGGKDP